MSSRSLKVKYLEQGAKLRALREERALSLNEAARVCNISPSHLMYLEKGISVPSAQTLEKLTQGLNEPKVGEIIWSGGNYNPTSYNHRQPLNAPPDSDGDKLKQLRLQAGLTQSKLALALDLTEQAYGRLERGYSSSLDPQTRQTLIQLLGPEAAKLFR